MSLILYIVVYNMLELGIIKPNEKQHAFLTADAAIHTMAATVHYIHNLWQFCRTKIHWLISSELFTISKHIEPIWKFDTVGISGHMGGFFLNEMLSAHKIKIYLLDQFQKCFFLHSFISLILCDRNFWQQFCKFFHSVLVTDLC